MGYRTMDPLPQRRKAKAAAQFLRERGRENALLKLSYELMIMTGALTISELHRSDKLGTTSFFHISHVVDRKGN